MRLSVNLLTLGVAVSWAALGRQRGHRASSFLTKKVLGEARCSERSFHEGKVIYVSAKLVWQLGRGAVFRAMAVTLHLLQVELGKQERNVLGGRHRCLPVPDSAVCKETRGFCGCILTLHFGSAPEKRSCPRGWRYLQQAGRAGGGHMEAPGNLQCGAGQIPPPEELALPRALRQLLRHPPGPTAARRVAPPPQGLARLVPPLALLLVALARAPRPGPLGRADHAGATTTGLRPAKTKG